MSVTGKRFSSRWRALTAEEAALWAAVQRTIQPLRTRRAEAKTPATANNDETPKNTAIQRETAAMQDAMMQDIMRQLPSGDQKVSLSRKRTGSKVATEAPRPADRPPPPALAPLMRREKQKLVRGAATIDARIDLHGMTQAEAHAALRATLVRSQANGAKFVLVITGKGSSGGLFGGRGVLRRQVPLWLSMPEFRGLVAGFDVAHAGHGGDGALYVRLRRARSAQ